MYGDDVQGCVHSLRNCESLLARRPLDIKVLLDISNWGDYNQPFSFNRIFDYFS